MTGSTTSRFRITEQDVSIQSIQKIPIDEVMDNIFRLENEISDSLSLAAVRELMAFYQQAVEYYSAIGDERFDELLQRMRHTLQDEDISGLLNSPPENA